MSGNAGQGLLAAIAGRAARVGVIGLGYVGLPLAVAAAEAGFPVTGFDIDPGKIARLAAGSSYIDAVPSAALAAVRGRLSATGDFSRLADCQVIVICVPTPLDQQRAPDLSFVTDTTRTIAAHVRPGTLVVLESTTWPGTTEEVLAPILKTSGLVPGEDLFLAFSPEREDPGNAAFTTRTIPKVVAGTGRSRATWPKPSMARSSPGWCACTTPAPPRR
ncbi:nucleotide sugar dehydrogenase [Seohaeicola zhoushanensis]